MRTVVFNDVALDSEEENRQIVERNEGKLVLVVDCAYRGLFRGRLIKGDRESYSVEDSNGQLSKHFYADLSRLLVAS